MRITSAVGAIIRSHKDALSDLKDVEFLLIKYGLADPEHQPANAKPFTVSATYGGKTDMYKQCKDLAQLDDHPHYLNYPKPLLQRYNRSYVTWHMHRMKYNWVKNSLPSREVIVHGSRDALKMILTAIKKRNLSPLSHIMLDDRILSEITTKSNLSSLTDRQLSCLDVSDDDFIGMYGIIDRWMKVGLPEDNPSNLLTSVRISRRYGKTLLIYSIDMIAILRKKVLVSKRGTVRPSEWGTSTKSCMATPAAYGFPHMKLMYATVEFAHLPKDRMGNFSDEPFLLDFHIHSL